jgi:hypothetical protein
LLQWLHEQRLLYRLAIVVPAAISLEYPTILDFETPRLNGYSRETTVAEKFEAMVKFGQLNSRMRDFFDIWLLSRQFDYDRAAANSRGDCVPSPVLGGNRDN